MFNLGSIFTAFNSVFGRELTSQMVKYGTEYVAKRNYQGKKYDEETLKMFQRR
jgi:hypothetical protein